MSAIRSFLVLALATALATPAAYASEGTEDAATGPVSAGSAARGEQLFMANACATCHGVTRDDDSKVGPNLLGVLGRKAGTAKSLLGTENLKKYGVIWSVETLDEFLANPDAKVPGTAMVGMLADPRQRADVIAYLATLKE